MFVHAEWDVEDGLKLMKVGVSEARQDIGIDYLLR